MRIGRRIFAPGRLQQKHYGRISCHHRGKIAAFFGFLLAPPRQTGHYENLMAKNLIILANNFAPQHQKTAPRVMWTRAELGELMRVYGGEVAAGRWRDYALADGAQAASFHIFRRTNEMPLYRIDKIPFLRRKQGQYVLRGTGGQVLRRGHNLAALLRFFARKNLRAIG